MTFKCGRIDVKYANCLYHARIGLGKWTHDPTLIIFSCPCLGEANKPPKCVYALLLTTRGRRITLYEKFYIVMSRFTTNITL